MGESNRSVFGNDYLKGLCHGDDFMVVASYESLAEFGEMLESRFDVRRMGVAGFGTGMDKEITMLNRIIRINDEEDCIELEPDAKHVTQMVIDLGLQDAKSVDTPRVKLSTEDAHDVELSPTLSQGEATIYRSATMRAACLSQDRVDITEAVKALSRAMATPREGHMGQVKRLARYLKGRPRPVLKYRRQDPENAKILVYSDSDWAGDEVTRRSTSGMVIKRGEHLIRHSSTMQTTIGLSSTEAEYYALTKGVAYSLGIQSLFKDWGLNLDIEAFSDSSSAISFAKRRGLGKNRHVATRYLWLQERVVLKHLKVPQIGKDWLKIGTDDYRGKCWICIRKVCISM